MGHVTVVGGSLPGLAVAARLARAGHDVTLLERLDRLGGRHVLPDGLPGVLDLPAAWRDFFAKTGRPAAGALGALGLALVPAADAGVRLELPADRGEQWHALVARHGETVAARWRDFVDHYDDVWQALRPLGLEGELTDRAQLDRVERILEPRLSAADAARRLDHPHLARLALAALPPDADPAATPGWLLSRLTVQRTFGRWVLVDRDGLPQPGSRLVETMARRVADRGVTVRLATPVGDAATLAGDAVVDTRRPAPAPVWRRLARGPFARPPSVREALGGRNPGPRRRASFFDQWLERPPLRDPRDPRLFHASAASRGGSEPWAQVLTGALAAYAVHETLTGEDIRPTNRSLGRH